MFAKNKLWQLLKFLDIIILYKTRIVNQQIEKYFGIFWNQNIVISSNF